MTVQCKLYSVQLKTLPTYKQLTKYSLYTAACSSSNSSLQKPAAPAVCSSLQQKPAAALTCSLQLLWPKAAKEFKDAPMSN